MTKKEKMYQSIEKHGQELNDIFHTDINNISLCKKLKRLEAKAYYLSLSYCNGENGVNTDNWEELTRPILKKAAKILNIKNEYPLCSDDYWPLFVNGDARGYALKIRENYVREKGLKIYQDWGGYGILAPDLTI